MSEITRRDALRRLAVVLTTAGVVDRLAAQEVHQMASQAQTAAGGTYTPKGLTPHEYRTLERLTDLIVPVENGAPGAVAAGCAAWIDMLTSENAQLKTTYSTGIAWLDGAVMERGAANFVSAPEAEQIALLDRIAYRRNAAPALDPGIQFFTWARRMTVDAFYTSEIGIRDIDYRGNTALTSYPAPTASIAYALKRSGLG